MKNVMEGRLKIEFAMWRILLALLAAATGEGLGAQTAALRRGGAMRGHHLPTGSRTWPYSGASAVPSAVPRKVLSHPFSVKVKEGLEMRSRR